MQPLKQAQVATHRIAQGEFDIRLSDGGAFEFQQLSTDINQMAQSLKHLEASRRLWIAQSAHELRTPLSVLLGGIESIQDGVKKPTPDILENLRQEVLHLTRLVNDLHVLSVADLQSLPCTFSKGDASELIFRIAEKYAPRLQLKDLLLSLDGPKNLEVLWDFGRIEQLVSNLLENSLRHTTAPGQIRLSWKLTESQGKSEVLMVIQDSAPGVTDSECRQVFEPLFRADKARVEHADGYVSTGLGLAVVRAIVQAHSGSVTANPSPLGGLEIVVQLPQTVSENSLKAS
jgi:two-component system, OmpR family, sensor histidine kinase BaeS